MPTAAAASSSALAPRVWQHAVSTSGPVARRCGAVSTLPPGPMRVLRLAVPSAAAMAPSASLSLLRRWASSSSSSGTVQGGTTPPPSPPPPPPPRSAPASSVAAMPDEAPGWVVGRKSNGEQRMSISIRSSAQRRLARRPPADIPSPSPDSAPAQTPAASGGEDERNVCAGVSAPSRGVPPYSANSTRHHTQHNKNIRNTDTLPPTPPPAAPSTATSTSTTSSSTTSSSPPAGKPKPALPSEEETRWSPEKTSPGGPQSVDAPSSCRPLHFTQGRDAAPPRAEAGAADAPASSASRGAPHALLYSVSRFTEPVKRIILIRNGRSEANDDVSAYVHTPDWRIPIVEEGRREAIAAGRALSELIGDDPVYFYYSPYIRSRQSLRYVLQGFDEARLSGRAPAREWWDEEEVTGAAANVAAAGGLASGSTPASNASDVSAADLLGVRLESNAYGPAAPSPTSAKAPGSLHREPSLVLDSGTSSNIIGVREDVRLRDGDIGRYTSIDELMHHLTERERYGKFFYRFPFGESGADVCDRVTSFLDAFQRERVEFPMDTNVVIITHGLTMRMFIKRWFHLTVETFHKMRSPPSGSLCTLTRLHHRSCFRLDESCVESMHLPLSLNEFNGYKYRNKQLLGSMSSGAPYM